MKLNTLEKIAQALETEGPEIQVSDEVMLGAKKSLEKMLEWSV